MSRFAEMGLSEEISLSEEIGLSEERGPSEEMSLFCGDYGSIGYLRTSC
jgi:hypothetical protein